MTSNDLLELGDIINNGFYDIELMSKAIYNDVFDRWFAFGCRWVPSRKTWDNKVIKYGWRGDVLPPKFAVTK